eukprot:TRINITY_DN2410_c0_g1_i5.p1 TRINITY_DN2410_c0_g1~~TRINITY_DN2410_c0_g1_i5.p1  ORF type:complete len:308 (-),score=39.32 TRINITY_DN2410_c0_g1_i5:77-1000(-)
MMREIDIAIIGAGPGGSATCFGLQSVLGDTAQVEIFERSKQCKPVGGIMGIYSKNFQNACNGLQEGLFDEVYNLTHDRTSWKRFDILGNLEREMDTGKEPSSRVLPWYSMQKLLQSKLNKHSIHLNHDICGIEQVDDGVILSFQNQEKVKAKLVVGADGNYSKTRMLLFDEKAPGYTGVVTWRLQCKGFLKSCPPGNCQVYVGNRKLWSCQCIPDPFTLEEEEAGGNKQFRTYISGICAWPEEKLGELTHVRYQGQQRKLKDPKQLLKRFEECFPEIPQHVLDWIEEHIHYEMCLEHAVYARDPNAP